MLKFVLDLFFPPSCGICGKFDKKWLCAECKQKMNLKKKSLIIDKCEKKYKKFAYLFLYEDIRNLILDYKFSDKSYLCNTFAQLILSEKELCKLLKEYNMIIPVPMSNRKKSRRGYNQTELIAKILGEKLEIEYNNKCLLKIFDNQMQSRLNKSARYRNIKNVFAVENSNLLKNKKVILFDDIVTTGATVDECSKVLKKNGVNDILVLSIAKD